MTRLRFLPIILLLLLMLPSAAWARTATADTDGDWGTAANWDGPDTLPVTTDVVVIPNGIDIVLNGVYPAVGAFASVNVQAGGSLTIPVDANSGLTITGDSATGFTVAGILRTAGGARIGAGFSCLISITPATDGGAGMIITSTGANSVNILGATKDHYRLLAADIGEWAASGDVSEIATPITSFTLDAAPTGWVAGDILAIAPTGRTYSHWDTVIFVSNLAAVVTVADTWQGAAPLYVGAAAKPLWNHQGTGGAGILANARAEVLNLSRNIKIFSTDNTKRCYVSAATTAVVTMDSVEFYSCGVTTAAKRAFSILTTTGSVAATNCVWHDGAQGVAVSGLTTGTVAGTNCIVWAMLTVGDDAYEISALALSGAGANTWTNCIAGNTTTASKYGFFIADVGSTFPGCRSIGNVSHGFYVTEAAAVVDGMLDNCVSHSNGGGGILWAAGQVAAAAAISTPLCWRNTAPALTSSSQYDVWLTSLLAFGNSTTRDVDNQSGRIVLVTPTITADPSFTTTYDCIAQYGNVEILGGTIKGQQQIHPTRRITTIGTVHTTFVSPNWATTADDGQSSALSVWRLTGEDDHRWYSKAMEVRTEYGADRNTASGMAYEFWPLTNTVWNRPPSPLKFRVPALADTAITIHVYTKHNAAYDETHPERIVITGNVLAGVTPMGPQACTVQDAGDTVTDVAHGMVNGTEVIFDLTANGLTRGIIYYVVAKAADTFQVSLTAGGAAVPITSNGTNTYTARDIIGEAHSGADESYEELDSATVTPTETGMLEYYVSAYGTTGTVWMDDVTITPSPANAPEDYAGIWGPANPFGGVGGGGTRRQPIQ